MQKWIALWLVSLAVVAGFTSALTRAQAPSQVPPPFTSQAPPAGRIVSGADIGFRVEGTRDGRAVGTLVVRIDGQWVETAASVAPKRVTVRVVN
jgi:hypothetical protein